MTETERDTAVAAAETAYRDEMRGPHAEFISARDVAKARWDTAMAEADAARAEALATLDEDSEAIERANQRAFVARASVQAVYDNTMSLAHAQISAADIVATERRRQAGLAAWEAFQTA